jgi:hypothetical protein
MPGAQPHPQSSWAEKENAHKSSGKAEIARHSLRNGLRLIARSPRRPGLLASVASRSRRFGREAEIASPQSLTPASGGQDHTTSPSARRMPSSGTACVHRILVPVTTRTPLRVGQDGEVYRIDSGFRKEIFACNRIGGAQLIELVREIGINAQTIWTDRMPWRGQKSRKIGEQVFCPLSKRLVLIRQPTSQKNTGRTSRGSAIDRQRIWFYHAPRVFSARASVTITPTATHRPWKVRHRESDSKRLFCIFLLVSLSTGTGSVPVTGCNVTSRSVSVCNLTPGPGDPTLNSL